MSLRIIHTADWHIGQTFFGYDRDAEHDAFLNWLVQTLAERQTDVLLIAGDVFDVANPSAAAQRRFYHFLKEANRRNPGLQIVVIAGNHDSAVRLEAPNPLLEELNVTIVGVVHRKEDGTVDFDALRIPLYDRQRRRQAWCLAVPYLRSGDYPPSEEVPDTYCAGLDRMYKQSTAFAVSLRKLGEALVAMGHLHATGAELSDDDRSERVIMGGLESVPAAAFPDEIAYTALGHIHKAQRVGGKETIRYAGSPLPMSFSEKNYRHQVVEIELEGADVSQIRSFPVPVLARLMRVPEQPAPPAEVLEKLAALPDISPVSAIGSATGSLSGSAAEPAAGSVTGSAAGFAAGENDPSRWPYVEVRVLLTEPDLGFRRRVEEALEGKAVRLTAIVPSYPQGEAEGERGPLSYADLQKIDPLDMLRHAFAVKYGSELPQEMEELFQEVMREVSL